MGKQKLKDLVKQLNADNAPPDGWRPEDQVRAAVEETVPHVDIIEANKPEPLHSPSSCYRSQCNENRDLQ